MIESVVKNLSRNVNSTLVSAVTYARRMDTFELDSFNWLNWHDGHDWIGHDEDA